MARPWMMALVQAAPASGADPVADLDAELAVLLAEHPDVQMVVYPEIHLYGDSDAFEDPTDWFAGVAEPLDGPRVRALAQLAAKHHVWLLPGSVAERGEDGRIFNTAVVFDPAGELVSSYRKIFPWRPYETWACGSEFVVFDIPDVGRFGLSICYDSWFPESTRQLGWLGAEVVLNIVKTVGPDRVQELVIAQANAIVNQVYFLSLNVAGPIGWGHSIYVDPDGTVLEHVDQSDPALTLLELDLDQVTHIRTQGTAGLNRLWEQLREDDDAVALPAYDGAMTPGRWNPARRHQPPER
ncbi:MAG TPA: carbon-nitrogen hydrolase family protein [Propionibacteriaceae bacterium]